MLRRMLQLLFATSLLASPSLTMVRAAQTAAATQQTPAQAAAAQAVTAQAAAVQAAAQARAAQVAARQAAQTAAATPAGPAQVAAQTAATQAAAQAAAAQVGANQAVAQAVAARQTAIALATAERQAAAQQALAARQQAAAQAAAARQQALAAKAAGATPASTAIAKSVTAINGTAAPAKPAGTTPSPANNPAWESAVSNILGGGNANPAAASAKPGAAGKTAGAGTGTATPAASTPAWESLVSNILTSGKANSASPNGKSDAPSKGGDPAEGAALLPASSTGGPTHGGNAGPQAGQARIVGSPAIPNPGLGMAEYGNTILTVMGCMRQGLQIACETDLSNQNKTETLVQSSAAWTDTILIDDRGDRHERSMGFFLNIDGEKRGDIDVPYGQSARYILVFNDVPAKVSTVSLHSPSGGLNVVNIPVVDPNASAAQTTTASADPASGAPNGGTGAGARQGAPGGKAKQGKNAKAAPAATPN
jgi:hypothetical protein